MQKGFSSILILVVSFAMIGILGLGIWYYMQYNSSQKAATDIQVPTPTSAPTSTPQVSTPQGWQTFTSTINNFTFAHPQQAQIREEAGRVNVAILGPTQTENTELFDALSLTLTTSPLNGRNLRSIAVSQQQESAAQPIVENVTQVESVSYADKEGYMYTVTSLGTRDIYILPFENDLYLKVTNSTVDPTDQGFQSTAEQIVSTIAEI